MANLIEELKELLGDNMYCRSMSCTEFGESIKRKKVIQNEDTKLAKVLSTLDLTFLGIGSTLGVGVYVLAGEVSKLYAGPAVIISFLIAAIASLFAGLCYAEFGARVPKAGSAYIYSYVTIGEFIAFLIGWNLILEYVIGSASVVKGLFVYLDALLNNVMSEWFEETMPINVENLGKYPDFFSFGVTILFSIALAFGAKESATVNAVFTVINLSIVLFAVISLLSQANIDNWKISEEQAQTEGGPEAGSGGFAPFGVTGIIQGAAKCFYGFIGFDCIATASEETKNPKKSIPLSIVVSLTIIFLAYLSISTALTMVIPYYEQDEEAPFPHVYKTLGWAWAEYIVTVGALCGLFSSLLGAMFPLPRIIYAMSSDGLLFGFLGKVHPKFQTPFMGTLFAGCFTGILACIFDIDQLFNMMSIGTLLAYSMVAACILILRYDDGANTEKDTERMSFMNVIAQFKGGKRKNPTEFTVTIVSWAVLIYCIIAFGAAAILSQLSDEIVDGNPWAISGLVILLILAISVLIIINFQPQSDIELAFKVPFTPWLPGFSIMINLYLMTMLDYLTWIQFGVWVAVGLITYFSYGLWNSVEAEKSRQTDSNYNLALEEKYK